MIEIRFIHMTYLNFTIKLKGLWKLEELEKFFTEKDTESWLKGAQKANNQYQTKAKHGNSPT